MTAKRPKKRPPPGKKKAPATPVLKFKPPPAARLVHARPDPHPCDGRKRYRTYSDEEKAAVLLALEANGGNVSKTARECGIPLGTVQAWFNRLQPASLLKLRDRMRGDFMDAVRENAWMILGEMNNPEKIVNAPLNHLASSFGHLFDKLRLLEGKPTSYAKTDARTLNLDLTRLTDDELDAFTRLARRLVPGDDVPGESGEGETPTSGLPVPVLPGDRAGADTATGVLP